MPDWDKFYWAPNAMLASALGGVAEGSSPRGSRRWCSLFCCEGLQSRAFDVQGYDGSRPRLREAPAFGTLLPLVLQDRSPPEPFLGACNDSSAVLNPETKFKRRRDQAVTLGTLGRRHLSPSAA